jgi:hypothetical protein
MSFSAAFVPRHLSVRPQALDGLIKTVIGVRRLSSRHSRRAEVESALVASVKRAGVRACVSRWGAAS